MNEAPAIQVLTQRIATSELQRIVEAWFGDMAKYVVDIRLGHIAIGGDLHADAEQILIEAGSRQEDLWGANYYPGRGRDACIEFTSLINIRPAIGNSTMEIENESVKQQVRRITFDLIGEGEAFA